MNEAGIPGRLTLATAVQALADKQPGEKPFAELLTHGTLRVGLYAPRGSDPQQPHDQDEVYIVMSGQGVFLNGEERTRFQPGDVLFVRAGVTHLFEEFTDDFYTWVVFYGPPGGEAGAP